MRNLDGSEGGGDSNLGGHGGLYRVIEREVVKMTVIKLLENKAASVAWGSQMRPCSPRSRVPASSGSAEWKDSLRFEYTVNGQ